jgi:hypothetical protein
MLIILYFNLLIIIPINIINKFNIDNYIHLIFPFCLDIVNYILKQG